jgi:DNA-directed RNA polymerase specialized sigma24 family protein/FixJ family two-component response regulator
MTMAHEIAPHLPYLRRFARTLCGRQQSGDAYVVALLESLVADPSLFPHGMDTRAALYRIFLKIWESLDINWARQPSAAGETEAAALCHLEALTPRPRQAFLLTAVEGFTPEETARIMDTDEAGVSRLLDEAGRQIAAMVETDVLIIEDEPLIAMDLESIVTSLGHHICAVARTRTDAIDAVARKQPGLVLADIELADGSSGLDAVNEILAFTDVPVVFVTAHPERLLTGERPEPAFLITKPFSPDLVKALISQALFFDVKARAPKMKAARERLLRPMSQVLR